MAAPSPLLVGWETSRTVGSSDATCATISAVASADPSSTTTISHAVTAPDEAAARAASLAVAMAAATPSASS
jgi:hypothetical protein